MNRLVTQALSQVRIVASPVQSINRKQIMLHNMRLAAH